MPWLQKSFVCRCRIKKSAASFDLSSFFLFFLELWSPRLRSAWNNEFYAQASETKPYCEMTNCHNNSTWGYSTTVMGCWNWYTGSCYLVLTSIIRLDFLLWNGLLYLIQRSNEGAKLVWDFCGWGYGSPSSHLFLQKAICQTFVELWRIFFSKSCGKSCSVTAFQGSDQVFWGRVCMDLHVLEKVRKP